MNLSLTLQTIAKVHPGRPAISWDGGQLTYGAFLKTELRDRLKAEDGQ